MSIARLLSLQAENDTAGAEMLIEGERFARIKAGGNPLQYHHSTYFKRRRILRGQWRQCAPGTVTRQYLNRPPVLATWLTLYGTCTGIKHTTILWRTPPIAAGFSTKSTQRQPCTRWILYARQHGTSTT